MGKDTNKHEPSPCCLTKELLDELKGVIGEAAKATKTADARMLSEWRASERLLRRTLDFLVDPATVTFRHRDNADALLADIARQLKGCRYPSLKPKLEALRFEREDYERRWELDPLTASHLIPQVPSVYRRK